MGSIAWGREIAEVYDATYAPWRSRQWSILWWTYSPQLVGDDAALEFAVGTGRIALPLSARGVPVQSIELSPEMVEQFRRKTDADAVPVTIGDMATTRLSGSFDLVYVVANSIMNLTTQEEQIAVFSNAAAHLAFGGHFVIELIVPQLRRVPPSEVAWIFRLDPDHVGIETFDDVVGQLARSHHWIEVDGHPVASTRMREAKVAGTSSTSSPRGTSCWASRQPIPPADSMAHLRFSKGSAQHTNCST